MRKVRDNIILVVVGLFFIGGYFYYTYVETADIKNDFSQTTGYIYEFAEHEHENSIASTRYKYSVNGKEYERGTFGMEPCKGMKEFRTEIMRIKYPIVYSNSDPEKSRILVSPKQFEEYGLPFPKEMKHVFETFWFCK